MARIEHVAVFANDLEAVRAFYQDAFGLRVVQDNSNAPVRGYFLADGGGTSLEVIERPRGEPAVETRFACHVAFWVDDYGAAKADLERRGARFESETEIRNDSFQTGFCRDPDGNRVQIVWRDRPLGS